MNRRQFLGRVFQSLISLHNSYSEYGIYHSWRQYQEMKTDVTIRFRYRTGRNPNYDPDSSGSSEYNYYNIPYTGADGPIIGIYNGDTLIYCSAYYQGTTLINTMGTSVTLKLSAGTYTIKVMRLGKGLVLGESGETMTFTIAPLIGQSIHILEDITQLTTMDIFRHPQRKYTSTSITKDCRLMWSWITKILAVI